MNKKIISLLAVLTLLLTTSQGIEPQPSKVSLEDLTFKEIESLYIFFERATYYLSDYLENDAFANLNEEVKNLYQLNEGLITSALKLKKDASGYMRGPKTKNEFLQLLGLDSLKNYKRTGISSFVNEIDPLLQTDLRPETLKSNLVIENVTQILLREVIDSGRKNEFLDALENGTLKLASFLPSNLKNALDADKKILKEELDEKKVVINGSYSRILLILNKLKPALPSLLKLEATDDIFKQELIRAYIKTSAESYLIEMITSFVLKEQNRSLIEKLIVDAESVENAFKVIEDWNRYRKIPEPIKSLKYQSEANITASIKKYRESFNVEYFDLREKVLRISSLLIERSMAKLKDELSGEIASQIEDSELAKEASKYIKSSSGNQEKNFFIDVKNDENDKVWLRIKVSITDKENLIQQGSTEGVEGEFFLVYRPDMVIPENFKAPLGRFSSNGNALSGATSQLTNAVKDLYIEVPLGFKARNMRFKATEQSTSINLVVFENGQISKVPLLIEIDDSGMWARFKKDQEKIGAFEKRFQFSEALGITVKNITPIPQENTIDISFSISWQLPGVFGVIVEESFSTKENQVQLKLSELKDLSFNEDNVKRVLRNKITDEVVNKLNAEKKSIRTHLMATLPITSMTEIDFSSEESFIQGKFSALPIGAEFLGIDSSLPVIFDISFIDKKPTIRTRIPNFSSLNLEEKFRKRIGEIARQIPAFQQADSVMNNLMDGLNIKDINWNPFQNGICVAMGFKIGDMKNEVSLNLCITDESTIEDQLLRRFQKLVEEYAKELAKNYLDGMVSELNTSINSIPDEINVFGLQFIVNKQESTVDKLIASVLVNNNTIEVELGRVGLGYKLTKFDASELKGAIETTLNGTLNKLGFLKFSNPSFKSKKFSIDISIDLRDYAINLVEDLGSLAIDVNGKLHTDKLKLPQLDVDGFLVEIQNAILAELSNSIQAYITQEITENQEDFLVDFAGQEIQIRDMILDIPSERFSIKADFLLNKGEIQLPVIFEFSIDPFKLLKIEVDGNVESLLQSGINAGANFLAGLVCDGCLKIDPFQFDDQDWYKPVSITGTLALKIPDLMAIPAIKFQLTKDGIDYDLKPRIPFPAPIPIGTTGFVLVYTYAEIDLEDKLFTLATSLTVGAGAEAYETAKLGRFDMSATINFNKLNRIDFTGDMVIANMALIYGGGYLDIGKFEFEFYQKTPLFLKDLIDYNTLIQVNGRKRNAIGRGNLGLLGVKANLEITAQIEDIYTNVKGEGNVELPLSEFTGSLKTKFIPYVPLSYVLTSEAQLSGAFKILDFEITNARINASIHRADIRFNFLDASLGASVPMLDALDEDLILDMIMGMFDFDPAMIADFISKLDETKISLKNIDISFGTPKVYASDGFGIGGGGKDDGYDEGYESDEGKNKITTTAGIDNNLQGGLPTDHMPFKYQSSKVDSYVLETHRKCKKFSFGFKVSWDCKNYTVKKEIFKPGNWPPLFPTLPNKFKNYHAIHENTGNDDKTGKRMYDLYSPTVHNFIRGNGQSNLILRVPIELEQRFENGTYYLCASKNSDQFCVPLKGQISQETIAGIKLYGNLSYGSANQPIKVWTSVGINPKDGVDYLRVRDSISTSQSPEILLQQGVQGTLNFTNATFIPFDRSSLFKPNKINLNGYTPTVFQIKTESPKGGFIKNLVGNRKKQNEAYIVNIDTNIQQLDQGDQLSIMEVLLTRFAENYPEQIESEDETLITFKDSLFAVNYLKDFLIEPELKKDTYLIVMDQGILAIDNNSELALTQAKQSGNDPISHLRQAVFQLSNRILITIPPNSQAFLTDILRKTYPNGGNNPPALIKKMYSEKGRSKFPQVANPLMEYIQNWIAFSRSSEPIFVKSKKAGDLSFTAWDISSSNREEDWSYSYVITTEKDDFEYFKIKLEANDLTKSLGLVESDVTQHRTYFNTSENVYYRFIQTEYKNVINKEEDLKNKVLLAANSNRVVYANMETNNAFSISIMTPGSLKARTAKQVFLLNDNISGHRFQYPYQYKNHQDFFNKVLEQIIPNESYQVYIKKIEVNGYEVYTAIVFKGDQVDLFWEDPELDSDEITLRIEEMRDLSNSKGMILQNQRFLTTRNRISPSSQFSTSESEIANFILSGFEGFNIWALYQQNIINPAALIRNLNK